MEPFCGEKERTKLPYKPCVSRSGLAFRTCCVPWVEKWKILHLVELAKARAEAVEGLPVRQGPSVD